MSPASANTVLFASEFWTKQTRMETRVASFFGLGVAAFLLSGCGPSEGALRTRAAFDMQCSSDQLQVTELARFTRGVSGCGKRGTYTVNAGTGEWILNNGDGPSEPSAGAPPAPKR